MVICPARVGEELLVTHTECCVVSSVETVTWQRAGKCTVHKAAKCFPN